MKSMQIEFDEMVANVSPDISQQVDWGFAISDRIYELMIQHGLSKAEFAKAIGTSPYAVAMWISGQYNFSLRTLARISTFFGEPLISVNK